MERMIWLILIAVIAKKATQSRLTPADRTINNISTNALQGFRAGAFKLFLIFVGLIVLNLLVLAFHGYPGHH